MIILTLILLAIMEVSLSLDNAVINATTLQRMDAKWQSRFITWGMPIAVFGMRLTFPILIVCLAAHLSPWAAISLAYENPIEYGKHLGNAQNAIDAFGGIFLLAVFLRFLFDDEKEIHWLKWIEERAQKLEKNPLFYITSLSIAGIILMLYNFTNVSACALAGFLLFVLIDTFSSFLGEDSSKNGIILFLYLELIDASCSFDGVFAAFVFTNNILLIMIGLGVGAYFVRSLTLYLVRGGTLKEYIYLEHGAHYGIGALALIMLADIFYKVPEPITGMIGLCFIGASLYSSIKERNRS